MSANFDDRFDDHPKYAECNAAEMGLIACAITYANRNLTDGKVPRVWPERRFGKEGPRVARELVAKRIWRQLDDGSFEIVGFLDHNPSAAEVLTDRARAAEIKAAAGRVGGIKSGQARRAKRIAEQATKQIGAFDEAKAKQLLRFASNEGEAKSNEIEARSDPIRSDPKIPPYPPRGMGSSSEPPDVVIHADPTPSLTEGLTPIRSESVGTMLLEDYESVANRVLNGGFSADRGSGREIVAAINAAVGATVLTGLEVRERLRFSVERYLRSAEAKYDAWTQPKHWRRWIANGNAWTLAKPRPTGSESRPTPRLSAPPMSTEEIARAAQAACDAIDGTRDASR